MKVLSSAETFTHRKWKQLKQLKQHWGIIPVSQRSLCNTQTPQPIHIASIDTDSFTAAPDNKIPLNLLFHENIIFVLEISQHVNLMGFLIDVCKFSILYCWENATMCCFKYCL